MRRTRGAFSLLELVVVVLLLGVVASVAFAAFTSTASNTETRTARTEVVSFVKETRAVGVATEDAAYSDAAVAAVARALEPSMTVTATAGATAQTDALTVLVSPHGNKLAVATRAGTDCVLALSTIKSTEVQVWTRPGAAGNDCSPAMAMNGPSYTGTLTAPQPIDKLDVTPRAGEIALTWHHPETGSGVDGFTIYRDGIQIGQTAPTTVSFSDFTAPAGIVTYTVRAFNNAGESSDGPTKSTYTTAPPTPTGVGATTVPGQLQVTVSWTTTPYADTYRVLRGGLDVATVNAPATSWVDTDVVYNTTYTYQVVAENLIGSSAESAPASATPTPGPPSPPTLTLGAVTASTAALSWTQPSGTVHGYRVYRDGSEIANITSDTTLTYTATGLASGTSYQFTVRAYNAAGSSLDSNAVTALTIPAAPNPLSSTTQSTSQITLHWPVTTGASGYQVLRSGSVIATITSGSTTSHVVTGLTAGSTSSYTVRAYNTTGTSGDSNTVNATTLTTAPTSLTATPGDRQVALSWTAPSGSVSGYYVYRDGVQVANVTTTSWTSTGLVNGVTYVFEVAAYNSGGTSARSTPVSAIPNDAYGAMVRAAGPIAYYRLDDASSTSTRLWDASGTGRHATRPSATAPSGTTGLRSTTGLSGAFDGTSAYVTAPAGFADFTGGFSAEAWVRFDSSANYARIFDFGNGAGSDNIILYRDGTSSNLVFNVLRGGTMYYTIAPGAIVNGEVAHFAVTLDTAAVGRIYKNGTQLVSQTLAMPNNISRAYNYIGRSNWTNDALFAGRIEEVAFYNKPLTAAQVMDHASARLAPTTPTSFTVTAGASRNTLAWALPVGGIQGFYVYRSGALLATVTPGNTRSWVNTGLTNGILYPYEIAAYNPIGASARTAVVSGTPTSEFYVRMKNSNPIWWWKLDDTPGNGPADASGNGRHGQPQWAWPTQAQGSAIATELHSNYWSGDAAQWGRTSDEGTPANTFTYSAWVNTTQTHQIDAQNNTDAAGTSGQRYVFWPAHRGSLAGAGVSVGTNGISVYEHGDSYMPPVAVYNATLPTGWNHVTITYNNRTPSIWLNGQLVHTGVTSGRSTVYAPIDVGHGPSYGTFVGNIDEPAVWNRVLSEDEIYEMYRSGKGLPSASTFSYTGGRQYYTIPSGVSKIKVEMWGAQGGGAGGRGGYASGFMNVTPGQQFEFDVAGQGGAPGSGSGYGAGGWPYGGAGGQTTWNGSIGVVGGGGGGRTQFFTGGGGTVLGVAGGGGGQGSGGGYGGTGGPGGQTGGNGGYGTSPTSGATPGYGASQSGGGSRGYNDTGFLCCSWYDPTSGGVNTGGVGGGGRDQNGYNPGSGGGGGAGLYGGGGGGGDKEYASGSGGGGGSSGMNGSYFYSVQFAGGSRDGHGLLRIRVY